jgi:hypothetical protein
MIVYNVARRFFTKKADAEKHRVALGRGASTIRIEVVDRDGMAALLNALCEPGSDPLAEANLPATDPAALVERAYVPVERSVPDAVPAFLVREMRERGYPV